MFVKRVTCACVLFVTSCAVYGQAPRVSLSADINTQVRTFENGKPQFHWYDDTGNYSRIRMNIDLEEGWTFRFRQKLSRIKNDPDTSAMDEIFLEQRNDWRFGKQYIPYGTGRVIKETAIGVRLNSFLEFIDVPVSVMLLDNGAKKQRGGVIRVGDWVGVSVALGEHFGINSTSFTQVRPPEDPAGRDRGYRLVYGVDVTKEFRNFTFSMEFISLREGHSVLDQKDDVINVIFGYQFPYGPNIEFEGTLFTNSDLAGVRISSQIPLSRIFFLSPSAHFRQTYGWNYAVSLQIRL